MKLSSQEEIGLRCLLELARRPDGASTIQEVARAEGLSVAYVAKILGVLKRAGLVVAHRGRDGGYALVRPPEEIDLAQAFTALGGRLYDEMFCTDHSAHAAQAGHCAHEGNCSLRPVLAHVDRIVLEALGKVTLKSLLRSEPAVQAWLTLRLPKKETVS